VHRRALYFSSIDGTDCSCTQGCVYSDCTVVYCSSVGQYAISRYSNGLAIEIYRMDRDVFNYILALGQNTYYILRAPKKYIFELLNNNNSTVFKFIILYYNIVYI
jgi:hypothetical protein